MFILKLGNYLNCLTWLPTECLMINLWGTDTDGTRLKAGNWVLI